MKQTRPIWIVLALGAACLIGASTGAQTEEPAAAADSAIQLTQAESEEFLRTAEVVDTQRLATGFTGASRATLSSGQLTHDAQIQTVDIYKREINIGGRRIRDFRDSYRYNIAAYELDKLLSLNLVPVSVERTYKGKKASFTWWVDDVMMTEATRMANNVAPPDAASWNHQINRVRVFTQLIYDTDPNLGNLLITRDWRLWNVDLTRSFRIFKQLPDESKLLQIDQEFYDGLKTLSLESIKPTLGRYLSGPEMKGLLGRRDRIIELFDQAVASKGREAVITAPPGG